MTAAWGWPAWFVTKRDRYANDGRYTLSMMLGPFPLGVEAALWCHRFREWIKWKKPADAVYFSFGVEFLPHHAWRTGFYNHEIYRFSDQSASAVRAKHAIEDTEEQMVACEGTYAECLAEAMGRYLLPLEELTDSIRWVELSDGSRIYRIGKGRFRLLIKPASGWLITAECFVAKEAPVKPKRHRKPRR